MYRHPLTLRLIEWGISHKRLRSLIPPMARAAASASYGLGSSDAAMAVCGATFNLNYWLGVEEKVGAAEANRLLRAVLDGASTDATAKPEAQGDDLLRIRLGDRSR